MSTLKELQIKIERLEVELRRAIINHESYDYIYDLEIQIAEFKEKLAELTCHVDKDELERTKCYCEEERSLF